MIDGARLLLSVFKLRIGVAIMLCTLAGAAVAPGPGIAPGAMAVLALAVLLSSCAAGAFNQYAERDLDARMARTRSRPFVTGRYSDAWYWPAGIATLLLPAAFGMGWLYLAGAAAGGVLFLRGSLRLVRNPSRRNAMANFHASLAQLGLLLLGALADAAL